ncbi:thioredoxin-dependent thiol peroxidase [Dyadobacter fanqingshengii]|uniref:thioredoxin-dependent peroxiredoxin n=1 Tax=Dyadobacter fanqingshengii TaxID=2906443 RepID=A0A9X1TBU5_9BACT|nr:thioredoxin-dependent thiol peroxidase [Dyadobacter fanqingshengii]MCF0043158.1 thioredoxin-dependent thiol peroxidase [Dyadobacter fanqingshengii]MCF0043236.1 thioredoxin-dependent thiol peroxidase [Dyadobacter fanqingshengii]MCF2506748.1 thioredoxin-dependent thiol peroxidase [Dyadobacter fanqingshengii]USJ35711.1 thioredoxin-dependent thiol peroxidase [Dyadobacter fanqingshengii]
MGLQVGDPAPAFSAKDQDGKEVKLSDFKGEKLILYFYPKDDTPGCTAQSCNLRDNYDVLLKRGYKVLGVSVDDEKSHRKFIKKYNLPFPLLADTDQKLVNDYGVWGEKKLFGKEYMGIIRTTFVIDEKGVIEEVVQKVDTENHTDQILNKSE